MDQADLPQPLHHRFYLVLCQQVSDEVFLPELPMPGEHELASAMEGSRITARGTPFSHLTAWVPETIGRRFARADMAEKPLLALQENNGITIARAEQTIATNRPRLTRP